MDGICSLGSSMAMRIGVSSNEVEPQDQEPEHVKKSLIIALLLAGILAFAVGVRGGWAMAHKYFESKDRREALR
jgi:hypothetical protein